MKMNYSFLLLAAGYLCAAEAKVLLERRHDVAAPLVPSAGGPPAAGSAQLWDASSGLKCVGWRTTLTCVPSGPRDPLQDKDCLTIIGSQESGFCECEGYVHTAAVPCGHDPVNCTKECGGLQKLYREAFGAGFSGAVGAPGAGGQGGNAAAGNSKDPYANALRYGQKAMGDVNTAVSNSNTLLSGARDMISKMMNLKPWAQITQLGKDAEEAGKRTQQLSKLARPFIYTQVETETDQPKPETNQPDQEPVKR